jgi:hypothetical protein
MYVCMYVCMYTFLCVMLTYVGRGPVKGPHRNVRQSFQKLILNRNRSALLVRETLNKLKNNLKTFIIFFK